MSCVGLVRSWGRRYDSSLYLEIPATRSWHAGFAFEQYIENIETKNLTATDRNIPKGLQ